MYKNPNVIFQLGSVTVLPEAAKWLTISEVSVKTILNRHATGDWGGIPRATEQDNEEALATQGSVESCHPIGFTSVWVVTDLKAATTTVYTFYDHFEA